MILLLTVLCAVVLFVCNTKIAVIEAIALLYVVLAVMGYNSVHCFIVLLPACFAVQLTCLLASFCIELFTDLATAVWGANTHNSVATS